ncbi:MAG: 4a-hydroxytetrahydrobiopterin dehydratase [Anaerolineales bacterium]|jgi:4a-hydroxytetrahydrobiopterin dehydratase
MSELTELNFVPGKRGEPPLKGDDLLAMLAKLGNDWRAVDEHHLEKSYKFDSFRSALAFTIRLGELAEQVNHHPEICLGWGYAKVTIWTHEIGGLHQADFIFAAKADQLAN